MKYLFITIAIILSTSVKNFAQVPAATIPDFTFYRLDKSAFTTKDIEKGKLLFFVFFDSEIVPGIYQDATHHLTGISAAN